MYPAITIGTASVPTFSLCVIAGITAFVVMVLLKLRKCADFAGEAYYVLPKIFISFGTAFIGAAVFDALFKIPENGGFKIAGMTFYGGAVTGTATLYALLSAFKKNTEFTAAEWLDLLTVPFLVFHIFGRIGCFLGGCCYGKATDSFWGIPFPDNPSAGIFHGGRKVLPTQLYEAAALAGIAVFLSLYKSERKFAVYCVLYAAARFLIEFLRGDDRGSLGGILSPAQIISVAVLAAAAAAAVFRRIAKKRKKQ